jgi:nicotinamide riboside kinase
MIDRPRKWENWLQHYRVELNAMDTPQFIAWLEGKMQQYGSGKLIPPNSIMEDTLEKEIVSLLEEKVQRQILQEAGYHERLQQAIRSVRPIVQEQEQHLLEFVSENLEENRENHWTAPIKELAREIVK